MAVFKARWILIPIVLCLLGKAEGQVSITNCPTRDVAFELITGYVFTSPDSIVDTRPGVLKLEDCIVACRSNATCLSVNYETGLCVLFSTSADLSPGTYCDFVALAKSSQLAGNSLYLLLFL